MKQRESARQRARRRKAEARGAGRSAAADDAAAEEAMKRWALAAVSAWACAGAAAAEPPSGWWNDAVFYEIFVRSFKDSEQGPKAGDGIGDFRGLMEKLDYLKAKGSEEAAWNERPQGDALGVNALWLMPIFDSPSYHGYDVTNYDATQPDYGTMEDMKALVSAAHERGIRVVVDLTLNHCSSAHPWFKEALDPASPRRNWFVWSDQAGGGGGAYGGKAWHKAGGSYFYGLFSNRMPDFNLREPAVTQELHDLSRRWLTDVGVDGFRLDAVRHLIEVGNQQENTPETHAWLKDYRRVLKGTKADAMTVGEVWDSSENASKYVGDELDLVFEFALSDALLKSVQSGDATGLMAAWAKVAKLYPPGQFATFLTNHDQTRVMTVLKGDEAKARLAATLLMTMPGVPFVYYGEEIGLTGDKPDERLRTPMPWGDGPGRGFTSGKPWQPFAAGEQTVQSQQAEPSSLWRHYQSLIHMRMTMPALRRGGMVPLTNAAAATEPTGKGAPRQPVLAFIRTLEGEAPALVAVNLSNAPVSLALKADPGALPADMRGAMYLTFAYTGGGWVDVTKDLRIDAEGGVSGAALGTPLPPGGTVILRLQARNP